MSVHPDELTGNEQAVLLVLMAEGRPVPNARLKDFGPELTKAQRGHLLDRGYIEVSGTPMVIELSEKGWRMCGAIVGIDAPGGVTGQKKALYTVLKSLGRYLTDADLALADVMRPAEVKAVVPAEDDLASRIRVVYGRLASRPGGWVPLTRVRGQLADIARDEVDDVLRNLLRSRAISLIPEENQKVLTDADDTAAIVIGGEKNHLMAIRS